MSTAQPTKQATPLFYWITSPTPTFQGAKKLAASKMSVGEALKKAIRSGNVEDLEESNFQNYGLDINSALGSDGYSALHWACHYGRAEVNLFQI